MEDSQARRISFHILWVVSSVVALWAQAVQTA